MFADLVGLAQPVHVLTAPTVFRALTHKAGRKEVVMIRC